MVYIWLGMESADTSVGVELLHRTAKAVRGLPYDLTADTGYPILGTLGLPDMFDPGWKVVAKLITREWFSRIWVIQELTVNRSRTFLCGSVKIRWDALQTLAYWLSNFVPLRNALLINLPERVAKGFSSFQLSEIISIADQYARIGPLHFHDLLYLTGSFKATDPRDKIFALMGISSDGPLELIDYSRDLRGILIDQLILRGKFLDKIHTVVLATPYNQSPTETNEEGHIKMYSRMRDWLKELSRLVDGLESYPTGMSLGEAQWRALCLNGGVDEPAPTEWGHAYNAWKDLNDHIIRLHANDTIKTYDPGLMERVGKLCLDAKPIEIAMASYPAGRRFCITEKGFIGWVSMAARKGDEVRFLCSQNPEHEWIHNSNADYNLNRFWLSGGRESSSLPDHKTEGSDADLQEIAICKA
ncbi:MAG: hypothetical protein Q9218_004082 [Villophora microphyllina]